MSGAADGGGSRSRADVAAERARYVPAAGRAGLTALYDPVLRLTMREGAWRPLLVEHAAAAGRRVVDLGCGTGTLAIALARRGLKVTAVDGDEDVLARARRKASRAGVEVSWARGLAGALPLGDGTADAVVCSLLLHHLAPDAKRAALRDAARVLRPNGRLLVADWGRPADALQAAAFAALRALDGRANTAEHAAGRLPAVIAEAGFEPPRRLARLRTAWGTLELLQAPREAARRGQ